MKKILPIFIFLICNFIVSAKVGDIQSLGTADICVVFKRTMVLDTVNPSENIRVDNLTLMAGKEGSAFYSEDRKRDLAMSDNPEYFLQKYSDQNTFRKIANFEKEAIFRDYTKNICIVHQRYDMANWELIEDIEKPKWEISDSIMSILGFDCIMATSHYRGRTWIAFFCPEIPISEGPWKLCGLPGIILKAFDTKNEYGYEAIVVSTKDLGNVEFYNYDDRIKIKNRRDALKHRKESQSKNLNSKVNAITGNSINIPSDTKSYRNKRFDFEETDYIH